MLAPMDHRENAGSEQMSSIRSHPPQTPADLGVEARALTRTDAGRAISRSTQAQRSWIRPSPHERAGAPEKAATALEDAAAELGQLIVREVSKPVDEASAEVTRSVPILRYSAQQEFESDWECLPGNDGQSLVMARCRPHGVAGLITPCNLPLAIPLWKAAFALAFGSSLVLKHAEEASAVALRIAEVLEQCLPQDLIQVLTGGAETGMVLVEGAHCVSITGFAAVGRQVGRSAADRGTPVQCEMGVRNASIVMPDAPGDPTSVSIASAAMAFAGQKRTATSRVIVVADRPDFAETLVSSVRVLAVGDPSDPAVRVRPLITEPARDCGTTAGAAATDQVARVLVEGNHIYDTSGRFMAPAVSSLHDERQPIAQQEVSAPVCCLLTVADLTQALAMVNAVQYGLAAAIYTSDLTVVLDAIEGLDVGMDKIKQPTTGVDFYAPFGCTKGSSYGPGEQGQTFHPHSRTVSMSGVRP